VNVFAEWQAIPTNNYRFRSEAITKKTKKKFLLQLQSFGAHISSSSINRIARE
jgi:hypothetical protein